MHSRTWRLAAPPLSMLLALTLSTSCSRSPAKPTLPAVTPLCEPVTLPASEVERIDCLALAGPPPSLTTLRGMPRCRDEDGDAMDPDLSCWTAAHAWRAGAVIVRQAEWIAGVRRCLEAAQ